MKKKNIILFATIFVTLAIRLYFTFSTPYLSYDSYFAVRQVEHIKEKGVPLIYDDLSYQGRTLVFSPLFYYILALLSFLIPTITAIKLISNVFAILPILAVYLIAKELTKKQIPALFSAFLAAFIPIFFFKTINSATVYSLAIPLMFFSIYCFMKISEKKKYMYWFIVTVFLLPLIHTLLSFLFILGLLIFMLLTKIENLKIEKIESESILFSVLVVFWLSFLIFKKAFLLYGSGFIWQNIPSQILGMYFPETSILGAVYKIGVIPFITGIFVIYSYLFIKKDRKIYLLISFAFAASLCLWLKLMQADTGLILLGVIFSILFAVFYEKFFSIGLVLPIIASIFYKKAFKKMKRMKTGRNFTLCILFIILLVSAILPSLTYAKKIEQLSPTQEEINALIWLKNNTNKNESVVATLEEGYLINYVAERPVIADLNFLLIADANQRFEDIERILATPYKTVAISLLEKYNTKYIYFSRNARNKYDVETPRYIDDECFNLVYDSEVKIYECLCKLK